MGQAVRVGGETTRRGIMKKLLSTIVLGTTLLGGGFAFAKGDKKPVVNTSAKKHANLNAAQKLSLQAFEKITAAQKANEFDMDGHAAKAKDLLDQVNTELKAAAEVANAKNEEKAADKEAKAGEAEEKAGDKKEKDAEKKEKAAKAAEKKANGTK
jgi:hypothetical protein